MATIISGNSILIPKTAITMPRVRNLFCRRGDMFWSTVALMTALSKESDVSNIPKIRMMNTACNHQAMFIWLPAPRKNHSTTAMIVKMKDHLKYLLNIILFNAKYVVDDFCTQKLVDFKSK